MNQGKIGRLYTFLDLDPASVRRELNDFGKVNSVQSRSTYLWTVKVRDDDQSKDSLIRASLSLPS